MRHILFLSAIAIFVGGVTQSVSADSVATPCSYSVESANREFLAVVFAPENAKKYECVSQGLEKKKEAAELRKKYSSSGVYARSASRPIWTFDWWAYTVHLANDGHHLVREGPWASKPTDEAVTFFEDGKLVKTYQIEQLVSDMSKVSRSVSHFTWDDGFVLHDESGTLSIKTLEGKTLKFRIDTGEMVPETNSKTADEPKGTCIGGALVLGLAFVSLFSRTK